MVYRWDCSGSEAVHTNTKRRKSEMNTKEKLLKVMEHLPEVRLCELLDFARFLFWLEQQEKQERQDWLNFGTAQFDEAYGPDEPEYTEADILKPEPNP
jgi:hypothetical protein